MAATDKVTAFIDWVIAEIGGDSAINSFGIDTDSIYMLNAPTDFQGNYMIIQRQTAAREYTLGREVTARQYFLIKTVTSTTDNGYLARRVTARVEALLTDNRGTLDVGVIQSLRPLTDVDYVERHLAGNTFFHVGTVFEVWLGDN